MKYFDLKKIRKIHLIGVGGIGLSSLAFWLLKNKFEVSGSDIVRNSLIEDLIKEKLTFYLNHSKNNIKKDIDLVIFSNAILKNNPELLQAKKYKIKCLNYPEFLGILTKKFKTITISGSHGKSTTTSLIGLIFKKANLKPNIIVGTKLKELNNKNFYQGNGKYLIIEADEYKAAFLNYFPFCALILNLDKEHLDFYKNLENIKKTFLKFIKNIKNGYLILNQDDENLFSLKNQINKIKKQNKINVKWFSLKKEIKNNSLLILKIRKNLKLIGEHNLLNAFLAYQVSKIFKIKDKIIFDVFKKFKGAWRRLEYKGKIMLNHKKIYLFDDYAHHPNEIKASLKALKEKFPKRVLICIFQPHQAKRLKDLFKDFILAFNDSNYLLLLNTYYVKGRDKKYKNYSSFNLALKIKKINKNTYYFKDKEKIIKKVKQIITQNKNKDFNIILMGAGDINQLTPLFFKKLKKIT